MNKKQLIKKQKTKNKPDFIMQNDIINSNENYNYIFCGDYLDRGLQNKEVLEFLTSVMRGEEWEIKVTSKKDTGEKQLLGEPPTLSQRQKAAELLAKRYQLFTETSIYDKTSETFSVNIKVV